LAGIGVVWIHVIAGKDIDFLGMVGAILLIGVVVNNGIVLIDYVNRLRGEGYERTAALLRAADRRFRPIAMTALTTIIGMIPLTLTQPSNLGLSYKSFGLTLIGGMSTATLLTLLVVPIFYTLFDDAPALTRLMARVFQRSGAPRYHRIEDLAHGVKQHLDRLRPREGETSSNLYRLPGRGLAGPAVFENGRTPHPQSC
jgi:hydrophobic/amphiphilic exporter-1 (mainly G- bacteria), HAE1 family